jgi:acyl dehydratase
MGREAVFADLQARIGEVMHVSDWLTVDQARINAFADATDDQQWIHVDEERARAESPYGAPIAHGYLTLSLHPLLRDLVDPERPVYPGVKNVINYGLNKLRFPSAVRAGSRVRGQFTLVAVEPKGDDVLEIVETYAVEVEGQDRPACVAETIMRLYF